MPASLFSCLPSCLFVFCVCVSARPLPTGAASTFSARMFSAWAPSARPLWLRPLRLGLLRLGPPRLRPFGSTSSARTPSARAPSYRSLGLTHSAQPPRSFWRSPCAAVYPCMYLCVSLFALLCASSMICVLPIVFDICYISGSSCPHPRRCSAYPGLTAQVLSIRHSGPQAVTDLQRSALCLFGHQPLRLIEPGSAVAQPRLIWCLVSSVFGSGPGLLR